MTTKEELSKQIGIQLTAAREEAGLTRAEVGKQLGLTERGYGHIEAGRSLLSIVHLLELPRIFGKPITYFLPAHAVSNAERNDPALDPLFQRLLSAWDKMGEIEGARQTLVEMAEHVVFHRLQSEE